MDTALLFQLISTSIMVIGVVFGIQNIRQFQAGRKRDSALLMLNSFQTNDFIKGLLYVFELPDKFGKAEFDQLPVDQSLAIYMLIGTWERLGVLVYRRELDLALIDDAYSGPVIQSWQKLERYVMDFRAYTQRETAMEWFQWLAERMVQRETTAQPVPAYVAHRDWTPRG
ncbi:MAG: hypothetical protein HY870_09150 [Chloroflexi bacterium]|nr:hypothetical protein [Chloroflexota bacterium]